MRLAILIVVCARSALGIDAKDGGKDPMNLPRVREAAERARARLGLATAREALDLALAERRRLSGTGPGSGSGAIQHTSLSMVAPEGGEATIAFRESSGRKRAEIKRTRAEIHDIDPLHVVF